MILSNYQICSEEMLDKLKEVEAEPWSPDNSDDEIEWAKRQPRDAFLYLVPGFGCGYGIVNLCREYSKPDSVVVVLENNLARYKAVLEHVDISELVRTFRLMMIWSDDVIKIHQVARQIGDRILRGAYITDPVCDSVDSDWTLDVLERLCVAADTCKSTMVTFFGNGRKVLNNSLINCFDYFSGGNCDALKDAYKGLPAICVAAGPSVDDKLLELGQNNKNAVIISCLSMFKPLWNNGIYPHFVTALDHHEISGKFLEGNFGDVNCTNVLCDHPTKFVLDSKVNPVVVEKIRQLGGKRYYFGNPWLEALAGVPLSAKTCNLEGATVAHLSFRLAEWLGCDPIILIGQDLALVNGKYYPDCVYESHPWKKETPPPPLVKCVEGQCEPTVFTEELMQCYADQFEDLWKLSKAKIVDCSAGVKKHNITEWLPFDEAVRKYCHTPIPDTPLVEFRDFGSSDHRANLARSAEMLAELESIYSEILGIYDRLAEIKDNDMEYSRTKDRLLVIRNKMDWPGYREMMAMADSWSGVNDIDERWRLNNLDREKMAEEKRMKGRQECGRDQAAQTLAALTDLRESIQRIL